MTAFLVPSRPSVSHNLSFTWHLEEHTCKVRSCWKAFEKPDITTCSKAKGKTLRSTRFRIIRQTTSTYEQKRRTCCIPLQPDKSTQKHRKSDNSPCPFCDLQEFSIVALRMSVDLEALVGGLPSLLSTPETRLRTVQHYRKTLQLSSFNALPLAQDLVFSGLCWQDTNADARENIQLRKERSTIARAGCRSRITAVLTFRPKILGIFLKLLKGRSQGWTHIFVTLRKSSEPLSSTVS